MVRYIFYVFIVIISLIFIETSYAETVRRSSGEAAALAKAQVMMRQMSQEKLALESENQELRSQLDAIKKKISAIKNSKKRLAQRLDTSVNIIDRYKENSQALRDRISQDRERMQELIAKFKELIQAFRTVEFEKAQLKENITNTKKELLSCAENNVKLVDTNKDLLKLYVNKGVWESLSQAEPITQLSRVQVENLEQEYENTIHLLRINIDEEKLKEDL
jgi:chromosome segregation ATPase